MPWDNDVGDYFLGLLSILPIVLEDEEPEPESNSTSVIESHRSLGGGGVRDSQPPSRQSARYKRKSGSKPRKSTRTIRIVPEQMQKECESPEIHTITETQRTQLKKRGRPKKQAETDGQQRSEQSTSSTSDT